MSKLTEKKNKKTTPPASRLVIFLAVLTLLLGTLGVYTALTLADLREQVRAVSTLESEVSGLQADLSDTKEQLKKAESDRAKVQKELEEKNKEIKKNILIGMVANFKNEAPAELMDIVNGNIRKYSDAKIQCILILFFSNARKICIPPNKNILPNSNLSPQHKICRLRLLYFH